MEIITWNNRFATELKVKENEMLYLKHVKMCNYDNDPQFVLDALSEIYVDKEGVFKYVLIS